MTKRALPRSARGPGAERINTRRSECLLILIAGISCFCTIPAHPSLTRADYGAESAGACGDKPLMYVDREISGGEVTSQERRRTTQPDHRVLGNVVQCDGARAIIAAHADHEDGSVTGLWTV